MLFNYANVLVFLLFAVAFVAVSLVVVRIIAPRKPSEEKAIPYECGEEPIGTPRIRFNSRYFVFAIIFLIFDAEIAFVYPTAVVFRKWVENGMGWLAFIEIFIFLLILLIGLVYTWARGDLEWVRTVRKD